MSKKNLTYIVETMNKIAIEAPEIFKKLLDRFGCGRASHFFIKTGGFQFMVSADNYCVPGPEKYTRGWAVEFERCASDGTVKAGMFDLAINTPCCKTEPDKFPYSWKSDSANSVISDAAGVFTEWLRQELAAMDFRETVGENYAKQEASRKLFLEGMKDLEAAVAKIITALEAAKL